MALGDICKAIDGFTEPWTVDDVHRTGIAGDRSTIAVTIKKLVMIGAVECVDNFHRPYKFKRSVSLVEHYEAGSLQGLYGGQRSAPPRSDGAELDGQVRKLQGQLAQLETRNAELVVELEKPIEVDPLDVIESLSTDEFAQCVAAYIHNAMAVTAPMKLRMTELHQRVTALQSEKESLVRRYEGDMMMLQDKYSAASRRLEDLTDELARLRESEVKKNVPTKVVFAEKRPRESPSLKPHVVHRKTPESVLRRNREH